MHVKRTTQILNLIEDNKLKPCHCSYAYILIKGTIKVVWEGADPAKILADRKNKHVVFKKCARFTKCISEINNAEQIMPKILMLEFQCII